MNNLSDGLCKSKSSACFMRSNDRRQTQKSLWRKNMHLAIENPVLKNSQDKSDFYY